MAAANDPVQRTRRLIDGLLNRGYEQTTEQVLRAIARGFNSGIIAQRVAEFEAEAARLAAVGEPLRADNPVLRALMADLETQMTRSAVLVDGIAEDVQALGAAAAEMAHRQLALPGFDERAMGVIGVAWNRVDPEAIRRVVTYTQRADWQALISQYTTSGIQQISDAALRGILNGQNPRTTARDLVRLIQGESGSPGLPLWRANTIMRTLQLTSYRDASALFQVVNADLLEPEQIRVATLDARTCMACIALHGTRQPVGTRIDDHWNGRCVGVPVVRGRSQTTYVRETGEQWFERLPETQQRAAMGHAAYEAWRAGEVRLQDFVHRHTDPLFGSMVREASLRGMLGAAAQEFYQR